MVFVKQRIERMSMQGLFCLVIVATSALAVEKPTVYSRTCVTSECHASYGQFKFAHKPVENGICKFCHRPADKSQHTFKLPRQEGELCFNCHRDLALIEDNAQHRGPVEHKKCTTCHAVHGSDRPLLLKKNFPSEFFAPFKIESYQLCFDCHPQGKVLEEETTAATNFRNGKRNLHYFHVNQKERTCRTCHFFHASGQPMLIREEMPYGNWNMPIHFEKTTTGGSCSPGCHKTQKYDRETPVVYSVESATDSNTTSGK